MSSSENKKAAPAGFATVLTLTLISFAWGLNYVVIKNVYRGITPMSYCGSRFLIAGLILMWLARIFDGSAFLEAKDFSRDFFATFLCFGISNLFMSMALDYLSASYTSIILATAPVFGIFLAPLFGADRFSLKKAAAIAVSLVGIYFIVTSGQPGGPGSKDALTGVAVCFVSAVTWSMYSIFSKPLMEKYSPLKVAANAVFMASIFMVPFTVREIAATSWPALPPYVYASFFFSIVFSSVVPLIYWNRCIKNVGPVTVMTFQNLVPVFALACAFLFLGETVLPAQLFGASVVVGAVIAGNL